MGSIACVVAEAYSQFRAGKKIVHTSIAQAETFYLTIISKYPNMYLLQ